MNLVELQTKLDTSKRAFNRELINQLNTVYMEVGREYVTYAYNAYVLSTKDDL